jgi:hypothetical protein
MSPVWKKWSSIAYALLLRITLSPARFTIPDREMAWRRPKALATSDGSVDGVAGWYGVTWAAAAMVTVLLLRLLGRFAPQR